MSPLPIIISPPFGSHLHPSWATPVLGSYTLRKRPGRLWQALKTIRPVSGGWRNDIGLRNPGIMSIDEVREDVIYSLAGFNSMEWIMLAELLSSVGEHPRNLMVEMNVVCPNSDQQPPEWIAYRSMQEYFDWISVKLPNHPEQALKIAERAIDAGIRVLHCTNARRYPKGSYSGRGPREMAVIICGLVKREWPGVTVIGGGGVYTAEHARRFMDEGADIISLSTGFTRPWNIPAIVEEVYSWSGPRNRTEPSAT